MCGILGIINHSTLRNSAQLIDACSIIRHRGPDDEGFSTWVPGTPPTVWAGADTDSSTLNHWNYHRLAADTPFKVGFGHRRLSILDLSPLGHQPMLYPEASLAICFNGEVYNYIEIKAELQALGHTFRTTSDTEVILHAWQQWGKDCLNRFNGMFAFLMLDYKKNELYAVRDRFGVKPLFYHTADKSLYLASEIKQIRTAPGYKLSLNLPIVRKYLATGGVNMTDETFDTAIKQLPPGHYMHIPLQTDCLHYTIHAWYELKPKTWTGTYTEAVATMRSLLKDTVKLRLRSDVKVGSCLSGGLDSSSIVCLAAELLEEQGDHAGQETVTACYEAARYDEWNFAKEVIKQTHAHAHQTFPSFQQLQSELKQFIWHQDEPTGSTSQFSQWAVFKATHEAKLKVMIDGQGADEQLAGYGGNDLSFYTGLFAEGKYGELREEWAHYKQMNGHAPVGFLLGAMQLTWGNTFKSLLPKKYHINKQPPVDWIVGGEPAYMYETPAKSLRENLRRQLYGEPLPALLRYEDHNSMAWSVESRTPFMDYRLVEFTSSLPARYVYKNGIRKTLLRDAMKGIIPDAIADRKDKMGFVTPEELWLKGEGKQWFIDHVTETCHTFSNILVADKCIKYVHDMIEGKIPFNFTPWRIVCLGIWYKNVMKG
ncbi:MAG: asparagine synthase (glutamine-hydrolyzing) [Chitinophagia bacterium]|nr:asparagine synthase (glutamine-hydrolyzing) [Chitinophagia bacterium]